MTGGHPAGNEVQKLLPITNPSLHFFNVGLEIRRITL
jgi:hypothetical protein